MSAMLLDEAGTSSLDAAALQTQRYLQEANPRWLDEMRQQVLKGRSVFLLYFNIRDIVFDPNCLPASPDDLRTVSDYLAERMRYRDIVLRYSLHSGIDHYFGDHEPGLDRQIKGDNPVARWRDLANRAASNPFPLQDPRRASDDPDRPDRWRTPTLALRLLTRALTDGYKVSLGQPLSGGSSEQGEGSVPVSIALIIDYLHHLAPEPGGLRGGAERSVPEIVETLQRWSIDPRLRDYDHRVVMLASSLNEVHPELHGKDSHIYPIEIPWPQRDERLAFLQWLALFPGYQWLQGRDDRIKELANRSAGMTYEELREFVRTQDNEDGWVDALRKRREEIIRRESNGLLVPKWSQFSLNDVAGYEYVYKYLGHIIEQLRDQRADLAGILFTGPPGTGKSFYAAALAQSAHVDVVEMGTVRGSYVGESERNFEQVLQVARNLAPVIIFVDEIDQAFSNQRQSGGDSGVEQRLFGRLLQFMDDTRNRGHIVWIAASNRPDLIDPALLSRFRLKIPFLLPDEKACFDLLHTRLPAQAEFKWQDQSWEEHVEELTETMVAKQIVGNFSGRELDTIVRSAKWKATDAAAIQAQVGSTAPTGAVQDGTDTVAASGSTEGMPAPSAGPPPIVGVTVDGKEEILVDAAYLCTAIHDASIPHDEDKYRLWSLLALLDIPEDTPQLAAAVRSVLPDIKDNILDGNKIRKDQVRELVRCLSLKLSQES